MSIVRQFDHAASQLSTVHMHAVPFILSRVCNIHRQDLYLLLTSSIYLEVAR